MTERSRRPGAPGDGRAQAAPRFEQVRAKCGHEVPMELYQDGKDKYRSARRQHIAERDCPPCRQKAHEERTRAETEAGRLRRKEKAAQAAQQPTKARLPDGSRFDGLVWHEATLLWTGTLTVPAAGGGEPAVFTASAGGVYRLLNKLDDLYRASLAASDPAAVGRGGGAVAM